MPLWTKLFVKNWLNLVLVSVVLWVTLMHVKVSVKKKQEYLVLQSTQPSESFNWQDYLYLNPDLQANGITTESAAVDHYLSHGRKEGRIAVRRSPRVSDSLVSLKEKLLSPTFTFNSNQAARRSLVIYHIGQVTYHNSWDVLVNNLNIFCSSLSSRSKKQRHNPIYLFSVVGGQQNPLYSYIPTETPNVFTIDWEEEGDSASALQMQMRLVHLLGDEILSSFSMVMFLHDQIRGPLIGRDNQDWLTTFRRSLLDVSTSKVGLVTSANLCAGKVGEDGPTVSDAAFALPGPLATAVAHQLLDPVHRSFLNSRPNLAEVIQELGYNVSSIRRAHSRIEMTCESQQLCDYLHKSVFVPWGGGVTNLPGSVCDEMRQAMRNALVAMKKEEPAMNLVIPETIQGGLMHDLYQQFELEVHRSSYSSAPKKRNNDLEEHTVMQLAPQTNSRVCFLVRTSTMHDSGGKSASLDYSEGLTGLIKSLLGQVNMNWDAYFFVTDDQPFDTRLNALLHEYHDSRLKYINIDPTPRLKFTKADAGYTATDHVLKYVLSICTECRWVTVTNGDNAYGSEVVENILRVGGSSNDEVDTTPAMLLNPIDSRNFAEQDYVFRNTKRWEDGCVGVRAMLFSNLLAFTIQPQPVMGRVDLAAVFFLRTKLQSENLYFGNFTNPGKYTCLGCQDGYLTEYLVRNRRWPYQRLPIDGMKSIVYHGPSPTLCIASGNVWFDHPHVNKVECLTHKKLAELKGNDGLSNSPAVYDWHSFQNTGKVCIRLTKEAFAVEKV